MNTMSFSRRKGVKKIAGAHSHPCRGTPARKLAGTGGLENPRRRTIPTRIAVRNNVGKKYAARIEPSKYG